MKGPRGGRGLGKGGLGVVGDSGEGVKGWSGIRG